MLAFHSQNSKTWQAERAQCLARVCRRVDSLLTSGLSRRGAFRRVAKDWGRHSFRSEPGRRLKMSVPNLYRLYGLWATQQDPSVFALCYQGPNRKPFPKTFQRYLLQQALRDETLSLLQLFREVEAAWNAGRRIPGLARKVEGRSFPYTKDDFYRNMPDSLRAQLLSLFKTRQRQNRQIRELKAEASRTLQICL